MDVNDRPWFKNYDPGTPYTLKPYPEITLLDVIGETAREKPDHSVLIFKGARMSYAELERLTDAFGAALVAHGIQKGDRVALLLPNSPQAVIAQIGAWKAGAIVAPLNAIYTERELEYALNEISAETVVVLNPFYNKVKSLQPRTRVKRVIATHIKEYLPPLLRLLFTLAKEKKEGYCITYGNMAMNTSFVARWTMAVVPNPRDINDLVETIQKVHPSCLHGVPTLFIALLNHPAVKAGKVDIKSMKICWSGAAPLMAETKHRFETLTGGWLLEAYGMTETMLAAVVCPVHGKYKEGSTGLPLPDVDVKIVDVETGERELGSGQVGEVIIQAPQIMVGYWERPTETHNMIRNGWVYTGDLGYLDEDGYLFIVDRKKDLIKPGGFQVWPREVEEVIATHPAVAEVSVAGVSPAR